MGRASALAWGSAATIAATTLATTLITASRAYLWAPYADPHAWLAALFDAERSGAAWRFPWTAFNQQRIPLALAVQQLDVEVVRGRAPSFLMMGVVAQLTGLLATAFAVARSPVPVRAKAGLVTAAALLLGGVAWAEDLAYPVFSVYVVVAGFAAAACAALSAIPVREWGGPALAGALAAATLASSGNAAGLAIWPVLLFWSAVERRDRRQQAVLWLAAFFVIGVLEWGLALPTGSGAPQATGPARLMKMATYLAGYAGLYWNAIAMPTPARLFGVVVIAAALAGLLRREQPGAAGGVQRLGRLLASFGLATAVLATLGRVDELADAIVPTRYYPMAALLQLGALMCWAGPLAALARRWPRMAAGACAMLVLAAWDSQAKGGATLVATSGVIRAAGRAFDAGDRSPTVTGLVHPNAEAAAAARGELRRRGLPW